MGLGHAELVQRGLVLFVRRFVAFAQGRGSFTSTSCDMFEILRTLLKAETKVNTRFGMVLAAKTVPHFELQRASGFMSGRAC